MQKIEVWVTLPGCIETTQMIDLPRNWDRMDGPQREAHLELIAKRLRDEKATCGANVIDA